MLQIYFNVKEPPVDNMPQGSLITKVKIEISNASIQVLIFFKGMKLRFLDLSFYSIIM